MKKETMTSLGAVGAALLAVACCMGPLFLVLFGVSFDFLGKLSFMESFRPHFFGAMAIILGYFFWKLYLKKPDFACPAHISIRRISRWIFWIGLVAVLLMAFP